MTENTVLEPDCGPHCGLKDGHLGHCKDCHYWTKNNKPKKLQKHLERWLRK